MIRLKAAPDALERQAIYLGATRTLRWQMQQSREAVQRLRAEREIRRKQS